MAFRGMTGFGFGEYIDKKAYVRVEIKTWNSKSLDIAVKSTGIPGTWERRVIKEVSSFVKRGAVRVNILFRPAKEFYVVSVNRALIEILLEEMKRDGVMVSVSLSDILGVPDIVSYSIRDDKKLYSRVKKALSSALLSLNADREREGKAMERVIKKELIKIENAFKKIKQRINILSDKGFFKEDVSKGKDVFEEINRLKMNIQMFNKKQNLLGAKGKQLDFIAQELLREANTFIAKVSDAELTKVALDLKTAADRIREVVQNVE